MSGNSSTKVEETNAGDHSVTNDQVNSNNEGTPSTTIDIKDVKSEVESSTVNGSKKADSSVNLEGNEAFKPREDSKREFPRDKAYHQRRTSNKSRFDPSVKKVSNDPASIRAQVEFYFSDSNLPVDQYLWTLVDGTNNRPVKISKIHAFKRLAQFQPYSAVVAALRDSVTLEVSGDEGFEDVRRKIPYDPEKKDERKLRSIYAKGFGDELPTTQFDVEAFFAQYGPTNQVRLRRNDDDKLFKGSVFVEFHDEETAQKFLALDPKPLWQGKHELKIMSQEDYEKEKSDLIRDGKLEPNETRPFRGRGRGDRGTRFRRDRDPDDWKKRREDDQRSGFKDNKRDRENHNHGGRGGRGRGRGDRRNNDRNSERDTRDRVKHENTQDVEIKSEDQESGKKRARATDDIADDAPLKRLDQKEEANADAS